MTKHTDTESLNRTRMAAIMSALARGDGQPFLDAMSQSFSWHIPGDTNWSGHYRGKKAVREQLLGPLFAQFETTYTNTAQRIFADGDYVIVECQGDVLAKTGKPYCNNYCWVIRMRDGMMEELNEYMDTALVDTALDAPVRAA